MGGFSSSLCNKLPAGRISAPAQAPQGIPGHGVFLRCLLLDAHGNSIWSTQMWSLNRNSWNLHYVTVYCMYIIYIYIHRILYIYCLYISHRITSHHITSIHPSIHTFIGCSLTLSLIFFHQNHASVGTGQGLSLHCLGKQGLQGTSLAPVHHDSPGRFTRWILDPNGG